MASSSSAAEHGELAVPADDPGLEVARRARPRPRPRSAPSRGWAVTRPPLALQLRARSGRRTEERPRRLERPFTDQDAAGARPRIWSRAATLIASPVTIGRSGWTSLGAMTSPVLTPTRMASVTPCAPRCPRARSGEPGDDLGRGAHAPGRRRPRGRAGRRRPPRRHRRCTSRRCRPRPGRSTRPARSSPGGSTARAPGRGARRARWSRRGRRTRPSRAFAPRGRLWLERAAT